MNNNSSLAVSLRLQDNEAIRLNNYLGTQYCSQQTGIVTFPPEERVTFVEPPTFLLDVHDDEDGTVCPNYHTSFQPFLINWRQYQFSIDCQEVGAPVGLDDRPARFVCNQIHGPSLPAIQEFVAAVLAYQPPEEQQTVQIFYNRHNGFWIPAHSIKVKTLDHIYLDQALHKDIVNTIDSFHADKERALRFGRYRYNFLLAGLPGSGKTSLVKSLALHYRRPIYILNLDHEMTDQGLITAFTHISAEAILLIEDIDTWFEHREIRADIKISFSALLNGLDGVYSRGNGLLTFVTTNYPQNLDAALIRPGRVDKIIMFGPPTKQQVAQAFQDLIPVMRPHSHRTPRIPANPSFEEFYTAIQDKGLGMAAIVDYLYRHTKDYMQHLPELLDQNRLYQELLAGYTQSLTSVKENGPNGKNSRKRSNSISGTKKRHCH